VAGKGGASLFCAAMGETLKWRETSEIESLRAWRSHLERALQGSPIPPPLDVRVAESPLLQLYGAAIDHLQKGSAQLPELVTTESGALLYSAVPRLACNLPPATIQLEAAGLIALLAKWRGQPEWTEVAQRAAQFAAATVDTLFLEEKDCPLEPMAGLTDRLEAEGLHLVDKAPSRLADEGLCLLARDGVVATTAGHGTGLGAGSFGDVTICTFGPQVSPLGDCSTFGIHNPVSAEGPRHRATIAEDSIEGVCAIHGTEGQWLEVKQTIDQESWEIAIEGAAHPLLFYVNCQAVTAGSSRVPRGALSGYTGPASELQLEGAEGSVTLTSETSEVQVIPLSGGDHFWGASFLIAYPPQNQLQFTLLH
jgi:hypothetical protein